MLQTHNATLYLITKYAPSAKQNALIARSRNENILLEVLNSHPVSKEDKLLVIDMIS